MGLLERQATLMKSLIKKVNSLSEAPEKREEMIPPLSAILEGAACFVWGLEPPTLCD